MEGLAAAVERDTVLSALLHLGSMKQCCVACQQHLCLHYNPALRDALLWRLALGAAAHATFESIASIPTDTGQQGA